MADMTSARGFVPSNALVETTLTTWTRVLSAALILQVNSDDNSK